MPLLCMWIVSFAGLHGRGANPSLENSPNSPNATVAETRPELLFDVLAQRDVKASFPATRIPYVTFRVVAALALFLVEAGNSSTL